MLSDFDKASAWMQKTAEVAMKLPKEKRAVIVALLAELLELVPPTLLSKGPHSVMQVDVTSTGEPVFPDENEGN